MLALQLLAGLVLLVAGGETLVRGASALAARMGVSALLVGLTVVGFGTSTPELVTSLQAAFAGSPGIAVGNVVGSNTANILLILGATALIAAVPVSRSAFRRDGTALVLATAAGVAVVLAGTLARPAGLALLVGLVAYIAYAYWSERRGGADAFAATVPGATTSGAVAPIAVAAYSPLVATVLAVGGIALTVLGARFLVGGATELATQLGVSEAVIGLSVVAVGTSLPELVTGVVAALRRETDIALGNVVGSNIYNILGILGATAAVRPIDVPARIAGFDVWVWVGATVLLVAVAVTGWRVSRGEGALLLAAYAAYIAFLV